MVLYEPPDNMPFVFSMITLFYKCFIVFNCVREIRNEQYAFLWEFVESVLPVLEDQPCIVYDCLKYLGAVLSVPSEWIFEHIP